MSISQSLLPEFDQETGTTRKVLARVPDEKFTWKPHEKSMTMGELAIHLAQMTAWGVDLLTTDSYDVTGYQRAPLSNHAELLAYFDKSVVALRAAIAAASDEQLMQLWSLKEGEKVYFSLPRVVALRGMILNHSIHHRGQLSVYLRLNDIAVPSIYGPSADEQK